MPYKLLASVTIAFATVLVSPCHSFAEVPADAPTEEQLPPFPSGLIKAPEGQGAGYILFEGEWVPSEEVPVMGLGWNQPYPLPFVRLMRLTSPSASTDAPF